MKHHIKIDDETMVVLRNSTITETSVKLPPGQLPRLLYEKVNKILTTAGGKWNRSAQAHIFPSDPRNALGMAIEVGEIKDVKKATQAFYTPTDLADRLIERACIEPNSNILEPSAGMGGIAKRLWAKHTSSRPENYLGTLTLVELDPASCRHLRHEFENQAKVIEGDFLKLEVPERKFERILMNPPFTAGQDVDHVTHAFKFLKPGGRLVAIMSPGWKTKTDKRSSAFRDLLAEHGRIDEEIPAGSFKESGTGIATLMVILEK